MTKFPLVLLLDNIRSAYNVGSALRTAECAGIEAVYTCGFTPPATHPKVKKTSLGAEELVESRHYKTLAEAIVDLQTKGYAVYALETGQGSANLWATDLTKRPTAFIFGHELNGVQLSVTAKFAVKSLFIPMYGQKESLNVANSIAIAVYDLIKRWEIS